MEKIVEELIKNNKTISTMESCTGGYIANLITNVADASKVLKFSAVTYSNEYKIKMGIDKEIIDKYSVYSTEVAIEMSKQISEFSNSDYGIGITGKIDNNDNEDNIVYISIYDKIQFHTIKLKITKKSRKENKELIAKRVISLLNEVLK